MFMFIHVLILFLSEFFWFLWFLLGVSYGEEVAPVEGIFYAKPALLDSDSDSEVDTDTDAQTVIYKSSPYSSPGADYTSQPVSMPLILQGVPKMV